MDYVQAILMGAIQGLTEFLPVSSSAHIVLTSQIYKTVTRQELVAAGSPEEIFFDIIIHLGTLIAILIYFRKDIKNIIEQFFIAIKKKDFADSEAKLPLFILLGTFFTALVILPLKNLASDVVETPSVVGIFLIITGFVLFSSEFISKKMQKANSQINFKNSILIGIAQGLAIFPGLSRSGLTIATGLSTGLDRKSAARYSFLLSIPIIIGASMLYPIIELDYSQLMTFNWGAIILGFVFAAFTGYFCIKYFIQFLNNHSINVFAYYCWIIGLLMFLLYR